MIDICQAPPWVALWADLDCALCTFEDFQLSEEATDAEIWHVCQENEVLLLTGNRNAEGRGSLELTIRQNNTADCLPVVTLADPPRILRDVNYARNVVVRLFEVLIDVEVLRGCGRLYLP